MVYIVIIFLGKKKDTQDFFGKNLSSKGKKCRFTPSPELIFLAFRANLTFQTINRKRCWKLVIKKDVKLYLFILRKIYKFRYSAVTKKMLLFLCTEKPISS